MKLVVIILSLFLIAPSYAMQDCETNLVSSSLLENVVALENLFKKLEPLNLQYELIAPRLRENLGPMKSTLLLEIMRLAMFLLVARPMF